MSNNNTILSHEAKIHGKPDFPYAVYMGRIPFFLKSYPLHWHEEFEIILVIDGEVLIQILEEKYSAHQNDIIIIPPGTIHSIKQSGEKSAFYFNLLFKFSLLEKDEESRFYKKYFAPLSEENAVSHFIPDGTELNYELLPHVQHLVVNREKKYENQELVIKAELFYIIEKLQGALKAGISGLAESRTCAQISRLKPVLTLIENHIEESFSIDEAADLCAMSSTYFMKFFKKMTGLTFVEYVNQQRLEKAANLLNTTDLSVSQIAEESGFNNFSYFIRAFKFRFGITPGKFRK